MDVGAAGWCPVGQCPAFTLDKVSQEKRNVKWLCLLLKSGQPSVATRFSHVGQALRLVASDVTGFAGRLLVDGSPARELSARWPYLV